MNIRLVLMIAIAHRSSYAGKNSGPNQARTSSWALHCRNAPKLGLYPTQQNLLCDLQCFECHCGLKRDNKISFHMETFIKLCNKLFLFSFILQQPQKFGHIPFTKKKYWSYCIYEFLIRNFFWWQISYFTELKKNPCCKYTECHASSWLPTIKDLGVTIWTERIGRILLENVEGALTPVKISASTDAQP